MTHLREYLGRVGKFENVGLVFGEVDIRWHIHREKEIDSLSRALLKRIDIYERFIDEEIAPRVRGRIIVFGAIPYSRVYCEAVNHSDGKLNLYARELDSYLLDMCIDRNFDHLSIFDDVIGPDGFLDPKYLSSDEHAQTMHLEPSITAPIVAEKLRRIFE